MTDTERALNGDAGPFSSAAVPTAGGLLAAIVLISLLVPVRRGTDELAVWLAAGCALVAVGAFVARRRGFLERGVAGLIATASSLLVVGCAGFAITQGVTASVVVPGLEWSVSMLFVAFFMGGGAVGIGVAAYAGVSGRGLLRRLALSTEVLFVGGIGLFGISIAAIFISLPVLLLGVEPTGIGAMVIEYLSIALGLGAVTIGYLAFHDRDLSFIDLERPTVLTIGWIIGGLVVILAANIGISSLMGMAGIEGSEHSLEQEVIENPDLLYVIVPSMLLIVGPFEELLYRNVIQKSLYGTFSRYGAIVVASVVFTLVHIAAYATAGAGEILASLSLLFVLSLILGTIYERTENLLVPALVHGGYNAVVVVMIVF